MANLVDWIERQADGKPVIAVVIGQRPWSINEPVPIDNLPLNQVLTWEVARNYLDYEFYDGFGIARCHAVYAWTEDKVIFITEYDGSTYPVSIPRNPTPCEPNFNGY